MRLCSALALPSSLTVVPQTNFASIGPTPALIFESRVAYESLDCHSARIASSAKSLASPLPL